MIFIKKSTILAYICLDTNSVLPWKTRFGDIISKIHYSDFHHQTNLISVIIILWHVFRWLLPQKGFELSRFKLPCTNLEVKFNFSVVLINCVGWISNWVDWKWSVNLIAGMFPPFQRWKTGDGKIFPNTAAIPFRLIDVDIIVITDPPSLSLNCSCASEALLPENKKFQ